MSRSYEPALKTRTSLESSSLVRDRQGHGSLWLGRIQEALLSTLLHALLHALLGGWIFKSTLPRRLKLELAESSAWFLE